MKKIFSIIGIITLIGFSFYYTNFAVSIIRNNDPIMKQIISVSNLYEKDYSNAVLINNNIIPGISGRKIDLNNSYFAMKKYGTFNEDLLVFIEVEPTVSINDIYDKYIRNGNKNINNISLIFVLENNKNVEEILTILNKKNVKVDFFLNEELINNKDIVMMIDNSNYSINLKDNYSDILIKKNKKILNKLINKELKFCYFEHEDKKMSICSNNKMYSIIPSIIVKKSPYKEIKNHIENGSIIKMSNSDIILKELSTIINYIKQKGYNIVSLNDLIKE